jgi:hypothetical protein
MDPAIIATIVGWFAQPAAQALFTVAQNYVQQRLGLNPSSSPVSQVEPLLDKYLQQLIARLDENRIAKLYGAFSKLKDATRSLNKQSLLASALGDFHEVARIPEEGTTGNRPNAELRCMAFVGMVASYTLLRDRTELIEEKMIEAVSADAATAEQWLGRDIVREIRAKLPAPTISCPQCGFQNPAGSRFCNRDGYPLNSSQRPPSQLSPQTSTFAMTRQPDRPIQARFGVFHVRNIELLLSFERVFDLCVESLRLIPKCKIEEENRFQGIINAHAGMTWKTWGDRISFRISKIDGSKTEVEVSSRPIVKTTLVDYGKNLENIERITTFLKEHGGR